MSEKEDFIAIFKAESEEHLASLDKGLVELEKKPDNLELVIELNRQAHTLKGSARVFGFNEIQDVAHRIEDIFEKVSQKTLVFNSSIADRIFKGLDAVRSILARIAKEEAVDIDVSGVCKELEGCVLKSGRKVENQEPKADNKKTEAVNSEAGKQKLEKQALSNHDPVMPQAEYIRVPLNRVNKLLNLSGEMVINKMKSAQKIAQAKNVSKLSREIEKRLFSLGEMAKNGFRPGDGDIAKTLSQCNSEIKKLKELSFVLYDSISTEAFHLDPVIDELQAKMKEMRMLPCSTIFEGFSRMLRDIASQEGKEVNLEISGEETELDKKVLEGIKASLIHILRNCIDHGIEEPGKREALGKPRIGKIRINAYYEAGNAVIVIEDDGQGMEIEQIKQAALAKRLVSNEELEGMSEKEIKNIVFMNGYSTSPIITDVSGRGIGLDVVRRDIENLKGRVILDTEKNKGTTFTLVLPLTIAIIQVFLLKMQGLLFAFPMSSISEIIRVNMKDVATIEGKMAVQVRGHTLPVVRLDEVIGLNTQMITDEKKQMIADKKEEVPVIIALSLDKRVGFIVDEVLGEEEVFIKSLGEHLGKVKNISGASILGTGDVVVILDAGDLITQSRLSHPAVLGRKTASIDKRKEKRILVVDDALSTRELEKSILEAQGYLVDTAVDGLDALDRITRAKYDLVVSDIQMPRMDGLEFCNTIKKNDEYKDLPVIIVSALDKEEDKRRGIEVGAAAYIIKTAFDQSNLLDTIGRLIG